MAPGVLDLWGAGPGPEHWTELRLVGAAGGTIGTCTYQACPLGP